MELIIAKDALKSNSPSIAQILSQSFFKEFATLYEQNHAESLNPSKLSFTLTFKDSVVKAAQKTEQRLKDEQKLVSSPVNFNLKLFFLASIFSKVKSQKRVVRVFTSEEEKKKQTKHKVM